MAMNISELIKSRERGDCMDIPMREAAKFLQAENKRLQEALEELKELGSVNNDTDAMQIIKQALAGE